MGTPTQASLLNYSHNCYMYLHVPSCHYRELRTLRMRVMSFPYDSHMLLLFLVPALIDWVFGTRLLLAGRNSSSKEHFLHESSIRHPLCLRRLPAPASWEMCTTHPLFLTMQACIAPAWNVHKPYRLAVAHGFQTSVSERRVRQLCRQQAESTHYTQKQ